MSKRYLAVLVFAVLLFPITVLLIPGRADGQADFEMRLYIHSTLTGSRTWLETAPPAGTDTPTQSLNPGEVVAYNLSYPLTDGLSFTGRLESGVRYVMLHLQESNILPPSATMSLKVTVSEMKEGGSNRIIASSEFDQQEMAADDLKVPMISTDPFELSKGSVIELRLELDGPSALSSFTFILANPINSSARSYIGFLANPIPDDGVGLRMMGSDGYELTGVIPNGPEELRTVDMQCSVRDSFGAYDVRNITILIISSEGNVLYSASSEDPEPSGGEPSAYFNHTYVFPEGTPLGIYDVVVTGNSNTGQSVSTTGKLEVRSGLFISLENPRIETEAGETVIFRMKVQNGGSDNDRVSFLGTSDKGWEVRSPETLELAGGDDAIVEFKVVVPIRSALRSESNVTMTATSREADRSYTVSGLVVVTGAATFGAEVISPSEADTYSGSDVDFDVRVINLLDEQRSFELSVEDLPSSWMASYEGSNGSSEAGLYVFSVGPLGEAEVRLSLTPPAGSSGRLELRAYVRAQGETERKYLYLSVNVVDPDRNVAELVGSDSRTATRRGVSFPVEFNKVFFTVDMYNPTLDQLLIDVDLSTRAGWATSLDYESIELTPGTGSTLNISIAPEKGTPYNNGAPYTFTLTADAGPKGVTSLGLKVSVPAVNSVLTMPEKEVIEVHEGESAPLNITFKNRGNTEGTVELNLSTDERLTVTLEPRSFKMDPGQNLTLKGDVRLGSLDKAEVFTITVDVTFNGKRESVPITVSAMPEEGDGNSLWSYVLAGIIALVVLIAVLIAVFLMARKRIGRKDAAQKQPGEKNAPAAEEAPVQAEGSKAVAETQTVEMVQEPPGPAGPQAAAPGQTSEEEEADAVMKQILEGKGRPVVDAPVEAEVLEAEVLE